uniref:DUF6699 domain-containing protein n=1 Tax=Moniliophthora roreri TaxID=221103 RepID=A0A0W0F463_MONRR
MAPRPAPEDHEYVAESSRRRKKVAWADEVQTIPKEHVPKSDDPALLDAVDSLANSTTTPRFFATTRSRSSLHTPSTAQQAPQAERSAAYSNVSYGHGATNQTPGSTSVPSTSAAVRRQEPPTRRLLPISLPKNNSGYQASIHTENSSSYNLNTSTSSSSTSTSPVSSFRHNRIQPQPSPAAGENPPSEPRPQLVELPALEAPDEPSQPRESTVVTSHYASSSHEPSYIDRSSPKSIGGGTRVQTPTVSDSATEATVLPNPRIHDLLRADNEGLVKWDVRVNPEVALGELPWNQLAKLAIEPSVSHTNIRVTGVAGEMVFNLSSLPSRTRGLTVQDMLSGIYDELHTRVSIDEFKEILPREVMERQLVEEASMNRCRYFHPEDVGTDGRMTIRRVDFLRDYMFGGLVLLEGDSRVMLRVESDSDK